MRKFAALIIAAATLTISGLAHAAPALKVGDSAPRLKVAKWVKGEPVKSFSKGKVYVVEFWATWCVPCKESIPHLTELAKKYKGKVTFTGVSVSETEKEDMSTDYINKVAKYVNNMSDRMKYNVAVDGTDRYMAKNWLEAAEQPGIPIAFIVGKDSKISWIGHPMADMDDVLGKVINNKFDARRYAAEQAKEKADDEKMQKLLNKPLELAQSGEFKAALEELDNVLLAHPEYGKHVRIFRYDLLMKVDEQKAYLFAQKLAETEFKDNPHVLNQLASGIVDDSSSLKSPDYKVAVAIAERAVKVSKGADAMILNTLAYAYFKSGDVLKAISTQEKAVATLDKTTGVPDEAKKEIKDRLEMFRAKKN